MLLLCISLLFMILPEKFTQSIQCFYQYFCLILIKLRKHSFCHLSVKFRMMVICHTSLVGKLDKYHSPVLFTSFSLHIALFYKAVHGCCEGAYRDLQLGCDGRHISSAKAYCLDNVHIIVGNIFIFICDDGFFLQPEDLVEQIHQHVIYNFPIVHSTPLLFLRSQKASPVLCL